MVRVVLLIVIAYLVWQGIERLLDRLRALDGGAARRGGRRPAAPAALEETLVRCPVCGVHALRSRTLPAPGGGSFCSEECRRRAAQSA
jgi:hypothetical protein